MEWRSCPPSTGGGAGLTEDYSESQGSVALSDDAPHLRRR